jgi:hypothetical protein
LSQNRTINIKSSSAHLIPLQAAEFSGLSFILFAFTLFNKLNTQ